MNIRTNLLLKLIVTCIFTLTLFWIVSSIVIDTEHEEVQKDYMFKSMQTGYNLLYHDLEVVNKTATEHAMQNEVISFLAMKNSPAIGQYKFQKPDFPDKENLPQGPPDTHFNLIPSLSEDSLNLSNQDFAYIYSIDGNLSYRKESSRIRELPESDHTYIQSLFKDKTIAEKIPLKYPTGYRSEGFLQVSDALMMYASAPVINPEGYRIGTVIIGRMMTENDTEYYSSILSHEIILKPVTSPEALINGSTRIGSIANQYQVFFYPSESSSYAYTLYPTLGGGAFILAGEWPTPYFQDNVKYFMILGFITIFLLFILLNLLILDKNILGRMRLLKKNMKKIESLNAWNEVNPDILLIPGTDDISDFSRVLTDLIRHMLAISQDLNRAKIEAEAANRTKSIFLANMSHEIRTPLNAIIGFSSLMEHEPLEPRIGRYVKSIHSAGNSLLSLINDVLDLSKIDAHKLRLSPEETDLRRLMEELDLILGEKAREKGLSFSIQVPEVTPLVCLDVNRLRQVLLNIVGNAIKFTKEGSIEVSLMIEPAEEEKCRITIVVQDTGIGIPKDEQEKIFHAFEQHESSLVKEHGGTGLGLSISRKLVHLMEGTISLESDLGKGSQFSIHIPASLIKKRSNGVLVTKTQSIPEFLPADVLIVDDVENNRLVLSDMLTELGLLCRTANNADEAITQIQRKVPNLVITDIRMPGMSGDELLEEIQIMYPGIYIPVVALTALINPEDEASMEGFAAVLRKPIRLEDLIPILSKYVAKRGNKKSDTPKQGTVPGENEFLNPEKESLKIAPEIAEEAKKRFDERLQGFRRRCIPAEVISLAHEMEEFGDEKSIPSFMVMAEQLIQAAEDFDLKLIHEVIKTFQEMVS